jgi:hypothetical protein
MTKRRMQSDHEDFADRADDGLGVIQNWYDVQVRGRNERLGQQLVADPLEQAAPVVGSHHE